MYNKKYLSKIDVPVLFIFFTRSEQTALVFEQIRIARPSKLYLYQDGPRKERIDDLENIAKCRLIAEEIDWECEVYKFYQDRNFGCDPSEFISQKWMFEKEEYGIILEDDDVPSQSFFPFCKELLEKYKDDERFNIICGMNNLGVTTSPDSYFFTQRGSIWGWATWKRNVDKWDENLNFLDNTHCLNLLKGIFSSRQYKRTIKTANRHRNSGRAYYESILGAHQYTNNQLNIVPCKNMISNIGLCEETTHAVNSITKLPKAIRKVFFMKRYEIGFPLQHPKFVIEDIAFKLKFDRLMSPGKFISFYRRCEGRIYRIFPFIGK